MMQLAISYINPQSKDTIKKPFFLLKYGYKITKLVIIKQGTKNVFKLTILVIIDSNKKDIVINKLGWVSSLSSIIVLIWGLIFFLRILMK